MNYIMLYIKRTFTRNRKKQIFLVLGITAFMAMLAKQVLMVDREERFWVEEGKRHDLGFSVMLPNASAAELEFMRNHEEILSVETVETLKLTGGLDNAEYVVSSELLNKWNLEYLYGGEPKEGEIVLTEGALVSMRQPQPGEKVVFEVTVGEERHKVEAVVSGVVKSVYFGIDAYVFYSQQEFIAVAEQVPEETKRIDAFVQTVYKEWQKGSWWNEMYELYGTSNVHGTDTELLNKEYDTGSLIRQTLIVCAIGGAGLAAIIYIILQDEKKNIGVFRSLGAKRTQIAIMLSTRILVSGVFGILLGTGIAVLTDGLERAWTYADTLKAEGIGINGIGVIFGGGLVALLVLQLPALYALLKETPMELMNEVIHTGENLIRLSGTKVHQVRQPLWWYSGMEGKRLKGRRLGLVLITIVGLLLPSMSYMSLRMKFLLNQREAETVTYAVQKVNGSFTLNEILSILEIPGVASAGFSEKRYLENEVEIAGKKYTMYLQVLDEQSFQEMKRELEQQGVETLAESSTELLGDAGILIRKTRETIQAKVDKGDLVQMLSPTGEQYILEIAMMGRNRGEVDADLYGFLGLEQYCRMFGLPEWREFTVVLSEEFKTVEQQLKQRIEGVSLLKNELLAGNTVEELNNDTIVSRIMDVVVMTLSSVAFLLCYYSFYYLAKTEEYRKLLAMGASRKMVQRIILLQSLRSSWLLAVANGILSYAVYRSNLSTVSDAWVREHVAKVPMIEMLVIAFFVVGISMAATWFASKQVLKELEQPA